MSKIATLTISSRIPTESYYHLREFEASAKRVGAWPIFMPFNKWCGLMTKCAALLDWLQRYGQLYDFAVVTDSWDVIWLGSPEEAITKYKAFNVPIVFNSESNCFPNAALEPQYNPAPTKYRFLNSGFFIGTPGAIIDMLIEMKLDRIGFDYQDESGVWHGVNDQLFYSFYYLANQTKAQLDYKGTIAQTLHGAEDDEFTWDEATQRVTSRITGSCPVVVHGNGGGKVWLEKIIKWMKL